MNNIFLEQYAKNGIDLNLDRWSTGMPHHPKSLELMKHLRAIDFHKYGDYFGWKCGGDGDNGETLMYQLDAYFELQDKKQSQIDKVRIKNEY